MDRFQPGDTVICTNPRYDLVYDKLYTVTKVEYDFIAVSDHIHYWYAHERFQKIPKPKLRRRNNQ